MTGRTASARARLVDESLVAPELVDLEAVSVWRRHVAAKVMPARRAAAAKADLVDLGYDINAYDLDDGNLTVKAANLLAFEPALAMNQSIVPGFVTLIGTGKFLATSSGPVIFVEPPARVDPEALVGWADCPAPSHHYDHRWITNMMAAGAARFGVNSGEERQFDFTGTGTILVQSSEKAINDSSIIRTIEGQLQGLSQVGLTHLNGVISQQLTS